MITLDVPYLKEREIERIALELLKRYEKYAGEPPQPPIPVENIVGTAIAVVYPFDRFHGISRPGTFEGVAAGGTPPDAPVLTGNKVVC